MKKSQMVVCERVDGCINGTSDEPPWDPLVEPGCVHRIPHYEYINQWCRPGIDTCMRAHDMRSWGCREVE
jgi:hypothetical protein